MNSKPEPEDSEECCHHCVQEPAGQCPDCPIHSGKDVVERKDKYHVLINGIWVVANDDQEVRIRQLNHEQLMNFRKIMGGV
jgi:hypothetical protein